MVLALGVLLAMSMLFETPAAPINIYKQIDQKGISTTQHQMGKSQVGWRPYRVGRFLPACFIGKAETPFYFV